MQFFMLSSILVFVRITTLVECLPYLTYPSPTRLLEISSEDSINVDEITDDSLTSSFLPSMSALSPLSEIRSIKQAVDEFVFQDDPDLEDVLRELLQDLSRHENLVTAEKIDTRSRTMIETYDPFTGEGEGFVANSRSSTRAIVQDPYMDMANDPYLYARLMNDMDDDEVKVVSRTTYRWRILEKTLRKMALDSTKVQIAYNIIREKQINFHPSSNVYKILEKSVSILHKTRSYYERPPAMRYNNRPPALQLAYPVDLPRRRRKRNNGNYFRRKMGKMNRYLKNKLARMNRNLVQKPLRLMFKPLRN